LHYTKSDNIVKTVRERHQVTNVYKLLFTETGLFTSGFYLHPHLTQRKMRHGSRGIVLTEDAFSWPFSHFVSTLNSYTEHGTNPTHQNRHTTSWYCAIILPTNRVFSCSSHGLFKVFL